jgi:predicted nucleic acid-binding protein
LDIVLDADASIKLTKISIIEIFASAFKVFLTHEVYEEHVVAGLKRDYEDAKKMKKLILDGKIAVVEVTNKSSIFETFRLGRGEKSVINYYVTNNVDLIISDDEAFLKILDNYEVPYTHVAGTVLLCVIYGLISKEKGFKYLESLRHIIKDEHIFYIKHKIEDL